MQSVTVTTQNVINYGAVLQSYAFQQVLIQLGIDDKLLNLKCEDSDGYAPISFNRQGISALYNNSIKFIRRSKINEKKVKFKRFTSEHLIVTKEYPTIEAVVKDPPKADVYITGGDQMFNASCLVRATNILNFGDVNTKRISYSTSLGTRWYEDHKEKERFFEELKRYNAISLREPLLPKDKFPNANYHIDPSLLLSDDKWQKFIKPYTGPKYILCYSLLGNERLDSLVSEEKKRLGLPVYVLSPQARSCCKSGDCTIYNAGPEDFLNLIYHAEEIISTSFHGVCFSIIFQKAFYCLIRKEGDQRYEILLNDLKLTDRIVKNENYTTEKIDYSKVSKCLELKKMEAIAYLRGALQI